MCGRYVLAGDAADYTAALGVDRMVTESLQPSWNVAPTDPVYVAAEWEGERLLGAMRWGLLPHWQEDDGRGHINARAETVATKAAFRDSFARRRCLIPADGFYEWSPPEEGRVPHWIHHPDRRPLAFAGIWMSRAEPASGERLRTCAIITTAAQGSIAGIHPRMPLILDPQAWDPWLDRGTGPEEAEALLGSIDAAPLSARAVSRRVNNVRNDGPTLLDPPDTLPLD